MSDFLLRGIDRETKKIRELQLNKPKVKTLLLLILLSGLFCFRAIWPSFDFYAKADQVPENINISTILIKEEKISISSENKEKREILLSLDDSFEADIGSIKEWPSQKEAELYELVGNYPIKEMIPFIAKYDREVAALTVGIAKKESNWGKRAPSKGGETCYNYWGYKSAGSRGVAMGYACFGSAEEAVKTVAGRIQHFVGKNLNTPAKMVIWKCGSSCAWDNPAAVKKWIADVSVYYNQIAYAK